MKKYQRYFVEILFYIVNILYLGLVTFLLLKDYIIFEVFMALLFVQVMGSMLILFFYYLHSKVKKLANSLKFDFITRFMEQPRMEGTYKKNWFQIHFTSRSYGEYWGLPRTYIKLQFKENKNFDVDVLFKYKEYVLNNNIINNIEHIKRGYKNYLLMRVKYYILKPNELLHLMDLLLKISKKANK